MTATAVVLLLVVVYGVLETCDALQGLRQTLITPVIAGVFLLRAAFDVRLGDPGCLIRALDTDVGGYAPMLLRTVVFAFLALAVCLPWCLWGSTRTRKRLLIASSMSLVYLLSSFGFMVFLGLAMRGLGK